MARGKAGYSVSLLRVELPCAPGKEHAKLKDV